MRKEFNNKVFPRRKEGAVLESRKFGNFYDVTLRVRFSPTKDSKERYNNACFDLIEVLRRAGLELK